MRQLGFSHLSAGPQHPAQDKRIRMEFKNRPTTLSAHLAGVSKPGGRQQTWRASANLAGVSKGRRVEIWFQDEMRLGQKNGIVRPGARRGSRPRQPADQRYESAYLFGAICPARGTGTALAMPYADTEAMQLHLEEISRAVAKGAHAVLRLDRAGWHTTANLLVPKNLTLIFLPSRAPELNPVETIWQSLRQTWLSNRVFDTYNAAVEAACEAACEAWRKLLAQPATIPSIGLTDRAHVAQT